MNVNFTIWLSVTALLITLTACQDHQIPASPRFRIKQVHKQTTAEKVTDTYTYDYQGRLAIIATAYSMRSRGNNSDTYYSAVFHYGADGKLTSLEYLPDYQAPGTLYPMSYDYEYDTNGNAVRIKYAFTTADTAFNRSTRRDFYLEYNEAKLPVKITELYAELARNITEYTYENGNVVKIRKETIGYSGELTSSNTYTYKFDDKPNPFYGLYMGVPDPLLFTNNRVNYNSFYNRNTFNKNNFISSDMSYEYDSTGHLVKIEGNPTTTLEYEMY